MQSYIVSVLNLKCKCNVPMWFCHIGIKIIIWKKAYDWLKLLTRWKIIEIQCKFYVNYSNSLIKLESLQLFKFIEMNDKAFIIREKF